MVESGGVENTSWLVCLLAAVVGAAPLQGGELQTHDDDEAARAPGVTIHQYEEPT